MGPHFKRDLQRAFKPRIENFSVEIYRFFEPHNLFMPNKLSRQPQLERK